jgi:hypothetical protein
VFEQAHPGGQGQSSQGQPKSLLSHAPGSTAGERSARDPPTCSPRLRGTLHVWGRKGDKAGRGLVLAGSAH